MLGNRPRTEAGFNLLLVLLLLVQIAGFFLHPAHTLAWTTDVEIHSPSSTHPGSGTTGHDPINCELCRLLNTSRSYLPGMPSLDLASAETDFTFVSLRQKTLGTNFHRAGFLSRAPPSTLLP